MPRRTTEEALRTKERILTQAIEVCTVEGYDKLSLSFVAEAASVTRGAIYHHFGNKEGLFVAAVTRLLEEVGGRIEAAAEAGATPRKALESGCLTFLQASQSPAYHRIILTDAPAVLGIPTWQELDYHYTTRLLRDSRDKGTLGRAAGASGRPDWLVIISVVGPFLELRFVGLRGPIEAALLDVAAEPNRSEAGIALLDAIVTALDRIDRNRSFREGNVRWEPLPLDWLPSLFADEQRGVEARLALSVVSAFPVAQPFATYRFGVEWKYANYTHTERPPARWVWGPGDLARVLGAVLARRLLDQASDADKAQGRAPLPATTSAVRRWLDGDLDESLFSAWLSRLALFDWRRVPQEVRALIQPEHHVPRADGEIALLGLMHPLVDERSLVIRDLSPDDLLSDEMGARTTEAARSLVALIRAGNLDAAMQLASSRYAMAGARLASFDVTFATHDPDRLVAALLFTISDRDRVVLFERWLRPRCRPQRGEAHV